ncbi:LORF2 protein, partial [Crocuta crocuta]
CKMVQLLWKTGWPFPKTLKIELPYNPALTFAGLRPGDSTPMFIATQFTVAKIWKQSMCPLTEEWIKKM